MIDSSIKDSKICIIGGDIDLFGKIAYSWKFDMIDEPLVKYRVHSDSLVATKIHLLIKEMEMMIEKYKSFKKPIGDFLQYVINLLEVKTICNGNR